MVLLIKMVARSPIPNSFHKPFKIFPISYHFPNTYLLEKVSEVFRYQLQILRSIFKHSPECTEIFQVRTFLPSLLIGSQVKNFYTLPHGTLVK